MFCSYLAFIYPNFISVDFNYTLIVSTFKVRFLISYLNSSFIFYCSSYFICSLICYFSCSLSCSFISYLNRAISFYFCFSRSFGDFDKGRFNDAIVGKEASFVLLSLFVMSLSFTIFDFLSIFVFSLSSLSSKSPKGFV
jgi:hypothetical protein